MKRVKPDWSALWCLIGNFAPELLDDAYENGSAHPEYIAGLFAKNYNSWTVDLYDALGYGRDGKRIDAEPATLGDIIREKLAAVIPEGAPARAVVAPPVPAFPPAVSADIVIERGPHTDTFRGKVTSRTVLTVRVPFNRTFNNSTVPGRWFDKTVKAWRCPVTSYSALLRALTAAFPKHTVRDPGGGLITL
jgi:hypothetical protein